MKMRMALVVIPTFQSYVYLLSNIPFLYLIGIFLQEEKRAFHPRYFVPRPLPPPETAESRGKKRARAEDYL
jgi:hypothetical protein